MSVAAARVSSVGMPHVGMSVMMGHVHVGMSMSGTSVRVTMSGGVGVAMVAGTTVLKCKYADDVDDKAENGDDEKSFVVDLGRLKQALKRHSHNRVDVNMKRNR